MKKFLAAGLNLCLLLLAVSCLWTLSTPVTAQSTIWEILPFPEDSDWSGSTGQPATTNGGVVTLHGRSVRTVESFSGALHVSYDVLLPSKIKNDGALQIAFLPTGLPTNLMPSVYTELRMEYNKLGSDDLVIGTNNAASYVWSFTPFTLSTQTVYHCAVDVSASGQLTWIINNLTNSIPGTIKVPYASYQIDLLGWQPDNVWQVSNFAVVPEPSTILLVTFGLGLLGMTRRRRSRL